LHSATSGNSRRRTRTDLTTDFSTTFEYSSFGI
jgi:hypothetical protein